MATLSFPVVTLPLDGATDLVLASMSTFKYAPGINLNGTVAYIMRINVATAGTTTPSYYWS